MKRVLAAASVLVLLASCSTSGVQTADTPSRNLTVFAAASLSGVYTEMGKTFEASHRGVTVRFSFEGSSTLLDQLQQGAPADVFASADRPTMDKATSARLMDGTPVLFATNTLTLIVPPGNPAGITGLDASLAGKKLVVCAPGVPCGAATQKLAELAGVTLKPVSEETKVTDVRSKVESGQADAGIVYVTDAKASGTKVETIALATSDQVRNEYLAGTVAGSKNADLAAQFVSLVTGPAGIAILTEAGFALP